MVCKCTTSNRTNMLIDANLLVQKHQRKLPKLNTFEARKPKMCPTFCYIRLRFKGTVEKGGLREIIKTVPLREPFFSALIL